MKKSIKIILAISCLSLLLTISSSAQNQPKPFIKRTTFKSEKIDFGAGGTVTIVGAPMGSIAVEGWDKNEIEVQAEIEIQAETEADLTLLTQVDGFALDEDFGHARIVSLGTHDRDHMKRVAKKFPKHLLNKPFRIDFKIKIPRYADLNIDGGQGDLTLANIDGELKINYLNTNAKLNLIGGSINATFGEGTVDVMIPTRSWRGRFAEIQLAKGAMNVQLPNNLNAEVDATILRTGQIENLFTDFKPRNRTKFSEKSIVAKAGVGGVALNFTVGDGTLKISEVKKTE